MTKDRKADHSWFSRHSHEVLEAIGNLVAVAVFIGIIYLIMRYLIKYG